MRSPAALALLAILFAAPAAHAVEIQSVDVEQQDARYRISMRVTLDAPARASYDIFTDLPRLPQINPSVREVQVLESPAADQRRVFTDVRTCVSVYCRQLKQVQDMRFQPRVDGGAVTAQVLPERSDLRFGEASWDFRDCAGKTCLSFDAQLEPAFWVPPLIGPWLIKRKMHEEAVQTSEGLERLARASIAPAP